MVIGFFMKHLLVLTALLVVIGFIALAPNQQTSQSDWSQWLDQTQSLFERSGELFSRLGKTDSEDDQSSGQSASSSDDLDEQLQALLPPEKLNLTVDPMTLDDSSIPLESAVEQHQFSNLFEPRVKDQSPAFKGKLHTDENNEIIGAEMQLAIPTN